MLNNKTFLRIFSLVAAVLLWMYVMVEVDPQKTARVGDITVSFANEDVLAEQGLAPLMKEEPELSVKIQGARSDVNEVKRSGLTAYVDVSTCAEGENSREIVINVPEGITVSSMSDEYMTFDVEEIVSEERPLSVEFDGDVSEKDGRVPWITAVEYENVTVSGAESLVKKVDRVEGTVSDDGISEERGIWVNADVTAVDGKGKPVDGVTIQSGESIGAEIRTLTVRTAELEVSAINVPDGFEADIPDDGVRVRIVGAYDIVDDVDEITGTVDLEGIDDTETHSVDVDAQLPDGVYLFDAKDPPSVKVMLTAME